MRFGRYDEVKQGLIRYNACNGICGWENSTEYRCTPTRTFLKVFTVVETVLRLLQLWLKPFNWLKGQPNYITGSIPGPTWSEKVQRHLPLGGDLREGTRL